MLKTVVTVAALINLALKAVALKDDSLLVNTTSGPVLGFLDNATTSVPLQKWYGVRYAQDTSGANRWRPPKPFVDTSGNVFNASGFGPACLQGRADGGNGTSIQSEDCLRINVIAPVNATNLPVYIYSYGGGFDSGASSDPKIDGSFLAAKGIVFASYNYRLSLWAWPHAKEIADAGEMQNFGLLDTRAAVEWIRDNAKVFGGESVGAEMTNFYMSAWPNDPIVRGAVMQSSDTSQPQWQLGNQLEAISKNLSCLTTKGQLDCLRTKSGVALQEILLSSGNQFQPVIDNITVFKDYVKQTREGRSAKIPLLIGTNKDEGTLIVNSEPTAFTDERAYLISNNLNFPFANFTKVLEMYPSPSEIYPSVYNATSAIWRDAHMLCLAHNLGKWRTEALGQPVWRYHFDLVADNLNSLGASIGTFHGEDIRFVMGTTATIVLSPPFIPVTPFEHKVSDYMVEAWTNFVKDPTLGPRISGWEKYDPSNRTTLAILGISDSGAIPGDHFQIDESCKYWNTILTIYPQLAETGRVR
ncbi:carboxylesterase [Fomitiporia mediterranea MF3/22]|uniref:carboxylesterase n=1 Tax=Fomitiporia mediterranea (strain MF3/22) TaxID=694068 RepID=UPI0004407A5B|nr:carboxylesterase [Fomitiporia mediterranea MF3/22]EJD07139.1 carboxylesterase [Fomitiporia mediterranea MF3/22]